MANESRFDTIKVIITALAIIGASLLPNLHYLSGFGVILLLVSFTLFRTANDRPISEYWIGEDGKYSNARIQALLWGYIILSYQVSIFIILCINVKVQYYTPSFSEETLWLTSLSMGSYLTVRGITNYRILQKEIIPATTTRAEFSDLYSNKQGNDFGRIQMLVWTAMAVMVYIFKSNYYFGQIENNLGNTTELASMFIPTHESFPNIDMTFIVLMGLSHGVYIGKKLIPDASLFTEKYKGELQANANLLIKGINFKQIELERMKAMGELKDAKMEENWEYEIDKLRAAKDQYEAWIKELDNMKEKA